MILSLSRETTMSLLAIRTLLTVAFMQFACTIAFGQEENTSHPKGGPDAETLKKANNPMADVKALNLQNYIVSSMYGTAMQQNQLLLRYSQPIGKVLLRATMPFVTLSMPETPPAFGMGDLNVFAIYTMPRKGNTFGAGPLFSAPTATSEKTGTGKWQAGVAGVAFFARSPIIQLGTLVQWQTTIGGDDDRADVNTLTTQLFFICQIGAGYYVRSSGLWSFNLEEQGNYSVPIGMGIGKVVKIGALVLNLFAEPQFTVMAEGVGQPKFQTFIGFNTQF